MSADELADRHLRAVFDRLVTAIYVSKQLVWSAPTERRAHLQDLLTFLIEQSHLVDEAEERIGGRAATMAAPSSHDRRNLLGEVGNDVQAALALYAERVLEIATDTRRRAEELGATDEQQLLVDVAAGLETRVAALMEES